MELPTKREETRNVIHSTFCPIYKEEIQKFLPMVCIFLLITFSYTITRSLKDIYLLSKTDPITLYFLKLYGITPSVIIFTFIYNRLSVITERDGRFNAIMVYFLIFFTLTGVWFFPNLEALQLNNFANNFTEKFPKLFGLWAAIRYWPLSLFYIHVEIWGSFAISVLFWTFANEIANIDQAKRVYSFISAYGGSFGTILAGMVMKVVKPDYTLFVIVAAIIIVILIYNMMAIEMKKNPSYYQIVAEKQKKKAKISFIASLKFLCNSKYLALISIIVVSYGMAVSLLESVVKTQYKEYADQYGDEVLGDIYSNQSILVGVISLFVTFFFSSKIFNKGWRFAASITPAMTLVMTTILFIFLQLEHSLQLSKTLVNTTPLHMTVMIGMLSTTSVKAAKYILFDPTKEAAYISLDQESKIRGKAAVEGIGGRLGKSLGSVIITIIAPLFGAGETNNVKIPILFIIFIIIIAWMWVIKKLALLKKQKEENVLL